MKARSDYEPLFSILDGMRSDTDKRFWKDLLEESEGNYDIEENTGQASTGVKTLLQMAHNTLTRAEEYIFWQAYTCSASFRAGRRGVRGSSP